MTILAEFRFTNESQSEILERVKKEIVEKNMAATIQTLDDGTVEVRVFTDGIPK